MKFLPTFVVYVSLALVPAMTALPAFANDSADTTLSSAGDAVKGKRLFNRCRACHNLTATARTRIGPNLDQLFGRTAGTADGFKYSKALQDANFIWTETALDSWLAEPRKFLPGNKMSFAGLRNQQDRKNLMAYLRIATIVTEE